MTAGEGGAEELFLLVADTGLANARIILAPDRGLTVPPGAPAWTGDLYGTIARELAALGDPC